MLYVLTVIITIENIALSENSDADTHSVIQGNKTNDPPTPFNFDSSSFFFIDGTTQAFGYHARK